MVDEEGEAEDAEATAIGRADEVPEGVALVVDAGSAGVDDEAGEVGDAEAADAEDRTLGQKVSLQVWISGGEHGQQCLGFGMFEARLTLQFAQSTCRLRQTWRHRRLDDGKVGC